MYNALGIFLLFSLSTMALGANVPTLESITDLPVKTLKAVESDGQVFFMSENGRFVIQGQLTDTWHRQTLDTVEEIRYAATHVDVASMGLPLESMNTIVFGHGEREILVFVDPLCAYCKTLITDAQGHSDDYRFTLIVVPALGDASNTVSRQLFCASDKTDALALFMSGDLSSMPQASHCDATHYDLTLTFAQLMDVSAVPYVIAPDGRHRAGAGPDLWQWVAGNND